MRFLLVALLVVCHPVEPSYPADPDAPLQLRDDADREQVIDALWTRPDDALRGKVAVAIARRISDALEEDRPFLAEQLLLQLTSLWEYDPQHVATGLADHAALLERLRATFAKSGASEPAIATLVILAEIEPPRRAERLAELDEVLHFADDLAAAEDGPDSQRAQPIAQLQPTVLALPLPWLVDRYVALLEQRQAAVTQLITQTGASIQLVNPHRDVLATGHRIANALARAGRVEDIAHHVQTQGLGYDRELRVHADAVADQPSANAYVDLAKLLRNDQHAPDANAALGVCLAGLKHYPADAALLAAAADHASALGRIDQPIALFEQALEAQGGEVDATIAYRLGKLYAERIARLAYGGRPSAAATAWHEVARFADAEARRAPRDVWAQVEANAETALGKGLLSQGAIAAAEQTLAAALDHAPSIDAYETLVTIHDKTDRYASAIRYAQRGMRLLGETTGDRYHRAKLDRLAGDAAHAGGRDRDALAFYLDALKSWDLLGMDRDLPRSIAAERKLEAGRALWALGRPNDAVDFALKAIDTDTESPTIAAGAVAFLLVVGRYHDALDAYHRGLGDPAVSEYYKVYMSLWVLAAGRRAGEPRDRLAYDDLASRHGDLGYERVAEAATGRLELAALRADATTAPRRAELAFYGAVLGLDPDAATPDGARRKLVEVVSARLVMDAEYDLARAFLTKP